MAELDMNYLWVKFPGSFDAAGNIEGCPYCQISISDGDLAKHHLKMRKAKFPATCPSLSQTKTDFLVEQMKGCRDHERAAQKEQERVAYFFPHECPSCDERFQYKADVTRHLQANRNCEIDATWEHKCGNCKEKFRLQRHLQNHLDEKYDCKTAGWQFRCRNCREKFRFTSHLQNHLDRKYACKSVKEDHAQGQDAENRQPTSIRSGGEPVSLESPLEVLETSDATDYEPESISQRRYLDRKRARFVRKQTSPQRRCEYCNVKFKNEHRKAAHKEHCDFLSDEILTMENEMFNLIAKDDYRKQTSQSRGAASKDSDNARSLEHEASSGDVMKTSQKMAPPSREVKRLLLQLQLKNPDARPAILPEVP